MAGEEPPYLAVGTDVSAKYKGAFCEAKVKKVNRSVKCKVTFKNNLGIVIVSDDNVKGTLRVGAHVEVKHPDKNQFFEAVINKLNDHSQYTVVFDDGDETTLRRNSLCLKSGRHFAESETLDQLPLTHPEHFGTPVIGSKGRKRRSLNRSTNDEGSSDDDLPPKKKETKQREPDPDIGKVVCVEVGDKKKPKDNWFPALVVSPRAQESVKVNSKDDYLVRSFKDGKYFGVPKKDTRQFTREIGSKVDNNTLKTAVEKASQYTDRDELPPHWDREILFGLNDVSEDGDSNEDSDSDSSDDEPSEEKDRFVAQLYKFMDDRGTPINKAPTVSNKDLNLCKLFKVVQKMGGYNRVTNHMQWKTVYTKMGLPGYNTSSSHQIKQAYKKYLHSFEDFYRKLGCTMGTSTRSGRMRHRSGRSFLLIRDRDREFKAAGRRKQENKKKHDKNGKDEEASKSEENKDENKSKGDKQDPEFPANNDDNEAESQQQEKGKIKEEKKNKIKKEKHLEKKNKSDKEEKQIKVKGRKKSVKDEDTGDDSKHNEGNETCADIDINVGDKVKVKYGKGRHQKIYEAKVLEVEEEDGDKHFYVHYTGWNMRYDEWVKRHRIVENLSQKARKGRSAGSPKNSIGKQSGAKRGRPPSVFGKASMPMNKKSSTATSISPRSRSTRSDKNSLADSPFVNGLEPRKRMRKSSGHTDHSNDCSKESQDENSDDDSDDSQQMSVEVKQEPSANSADSEFSELAPNEEPSFAQFSAESQNLFSKTIKKGRKPKKITEKFLNIEDEDGDGDIEDGDEDDEEMNYDDEMDNESGSEDQNSKAKLLSECSKKIRKMIKKEKKEEDNVEVKRKKRNKKSKESSDNDGKSDSSKDSPGKHGSDENNDEALEELDAELQINVETSVITESMSKKKDEENHDEKEFDRGLKVKKKGKKIKKEDTPNILQSNNENEEDDNSNNNNSDNCSFHGTDAEKCDSEENEKETKLELELIGKNTSNSSQEHDETFDSKEETETDELSFKSDLVKDSKLEDNVCEAEITTNNVDNSEPPVSVCLSENKEDNNECNVSEENSEKVDDQEECPAPILVQSVNVREFSDSEPLVSNLEKYSTLSEEGIDKEPELPEIIKLVEEKEDDTEDDLEHKKRNKKKGKGKKENEDESTELSEAESDSKKIKSRSGKNSKSKRSKLTINNETDFRNNEPIIGHHETFKTDELEKEKEPVKNNELSMNNSDRSEIISTINISNSSETESTTSSMDGNLKIVDFVSDSSHGTSITTSENDNCIQPQNVFMLDDHKDKGKEKEKKHHKLEVQVEKKDSCVSLEQMTKGLVSVMVYEEKNSQSRKEPPLKWDEKGIESEVVKIEDMKKKNKEEEKKRADDKKVKDEEKKLKEPKQKKSKEKKSKSKRDDAVGKSDKESSKDSEKKDSEKAKKKESKKKRDAEKRKLEKNESDLESVENSEVLRKKEKKRKSKQEDRKKDGETFKKKSKKKGLKEHEKLSDEDLKEMKESKKTGKKSDKLGKSKKKKDKSKKESQSDEHEGGKAKSEKEHGKKTEKRMKAESAKLNIEKNIVSIKEEPEYDDVTNLLLCREDVPMSPVAGDNQLCKPEMELALPNLVQDNQFDVRISEDSIPLPVAHNTTFNVVSMGSCEGESSSQSFFKNDQESSVVLDNTPPTTPESAISTMSGSLHECDSISPGRDEESTKSGQESINYMDLEHYDDVSRLVCHENVDFAQSEAALVLGSLGVQGFDKRQALMNCAAITAKRSRTEFEELTPKKKKKSRRRSHSTSEVGKNMNSPRHKHSSCKLNKTTASDSDETLPSEQVSNSFQTHHGHSSINNNSSSSSSSYTGSDRESGLIPPSLHSPKPSKFNFFVELDDYLDGTERIAILQEKLADLRKTYMALKAEVACIDRRRKKLRKKEKEGTATTANVVEVEYS